MAGGDGRGSAGAARLQHFLRMGQESGCYQPGSRPLTKDKVSSIEQLIAENRGPEAVGVTVQFSREGAGTRSETVPFALAMCARSNETKTKLAAYAAVQELCKSPLELFLFVYYTEMLSQPTTGWGRAQRKAVCTWYNSRDPRQLAEAVSRYVSRHHWTHKDLFRLAHIKPSSNGVAVVMKYVAKGLDAAKKEFGGENGPGEIQDILTYLQAVEELKHTKDEQLAARLIESHNLCFEHVPTHFMKSKEVWTALVPRIPLGILLKHLPSLSQLGFLRPNNAMVPLIIEQFKNEIASPQASLHPVDIFLALKKYEESAKAPTGRPTKHRLTPIIMESLHSLFLASFKTLAPTGKRFLVAVDVRNPMVHSKIPGCPHLTPAIAAALLILSFLHAEGPGMVQVVAFSTRDMLPIDLSPDMLLTEVTKCMRETPMGPVNCAKPIVWAKNSQKAVDIFVVCTDTQTKPSEIHPIEALRQYRQSLNLPSAKFVVCALASKGFTLASPDDPNMLDISGFDNHVPNIISHFARSSC